MLYTPVEHYVNYLDAFVSAALTDETGAKVPSPVGGPIGERSTRGSVSNENNILLDPDVLTGYPTQALLLTVLVSNPLKEIYGMNSNKKDTYYHASIKEIGFMLLWYNQIKLF